MPSAELIGLQAPKKAHRSLVFALAAACRQIESAGLIGAASRSSFGGAISREPLSIFRHRRAHPPISKMQRLTLTSRRLLKSWQPRTVPPRWALVMKDWRKVRLETLAVHAGHEIDAATGAVAAPIHLSTTFERDVEGTYSRGFMYTRNDNPNRKALEQGVSALEGGAAAAAFGSGMASAMGLLGALAPGDHVLAHVDAYYGTSRLLRDLFLRWKLEADFVDMSDLLAVKKALRPNTKLVWMETPSNPLLKIVDLAAVAEITHEAGAVCVCDNTWAPIIQRPFEADADFILHSTTKYFGGHCDVLGGIVIAKRDDEFFHVVRSIQYSGGAVPSPFDCWVILRGMKTLPWRMRAHCENGAKVAEFLAQNRNVERVHYPGLKSHPGYEIAKRQMSMFGGMLSFETKGGREAAMAVAAKTKIFTRATSLWGVESLIEHRASIEGPGTTSPESLLRCSIGLEHPDDLIEDLNQSLA